MDLKDYKIANVEHDYKEWIYKFLTDDFELEKEEIPFHGQLMQGREFMNQCDYQTAISLYEEMLNLQLIENEMLKGNCKYIIGLWCLYEIYNNYGVCLVLVNNVEAGLKAFSEALSYELMLCRTALYNLNTMKISSTLYGKERFLVWNNIQITLPDKIIIETPLEYLSHADYIFIMTSYVHDNNKIIMESDILFLLVFSAFPVFVISVDKNMSKKVRTNAENLWEYYVKKYNFIVYTNKERWTPMPFYAKLKDFLKAFKGKRSLKIIAKIIYKDLTSVALAKQANANVNDCEVSKDKETYEHNSLRIKEQTMNRIGDYSVDKEPESIVVNTPFTYENKEVDYLAPIKSVRILIDKGVEMKRGHDYEGALEQYIKAAQIIPTAGNVYYAMGKLLYILGRYEQAANAYFLAYIYGAYNPAEDVYRHFGHAVRDGKTEIVEQYKNSIQKYKESLSLPNGFLFVDRLYEETCIENGKNNLLELVKERRKNNG